MAQPFPSITKTWHTSSYPAISPTRPELSAVDKTVVVTGGGTGIGANMAKAFAEAGSKKIAILGRRARPLQETAQKLEAEFPGLEVLPLATDITDKSKVDTAFESIVQRFGPVDVLMSNAGLISGGGTVSDLDIADAWVSFEIHIKGTLNVAQAFKRAARASGVTVVDTSSIVAILPPWPGAVSYTAGKLAATKIWEFFGVENPEIRVVSIQPGRVYTDMAKQIGVTGLDDIDLPAHFSVWLASPEAHFLDGKFVCANWDVDELKAKEEEYTTTEFGTIRLVGFPSTKA